MEKIARLCWNDNGWVKPSGKYGKSKTGNAWEAKGKYGHEEWLFDVGRLVNGYHYGFIEAIQKCKAKDKNQPLVINFFSINCNKSERWWLGKIKKIEFVPENEARKIYQLYKDKGWLDEMIEQLKLVNGDWKEYVKSAPKYMVNVKYLPENMELLEEPQCFSLRDPAVKAVYYGRLYNKKIEPEFFKKVNQDFIFKAGYRKKSITSTAHYGKREIDIDRFHERMQMGIYKELVKMFGIKNVGTDQLVGLNRIDIVAKNKNDYIFYELKTHNSIKMCIREALGQLLEYAFFPDKCYAKNIVIISQNRITAEAKTYLRSLRERLKIPVYYRHYNQSTQSLDREW